jgi:hypothetical protein
MCLSRIKENIFFKITGIYLICALVFCFVLPKEALAARSNAGGGDTTLWSWEDFALTVFFSLAGTVIGGAISSALGDSSFYTTLAKNINYDNLVKGYTTYVAASQVGGAVGAAGTYYDWDRNVTYVASAAAIGATAGFLNPSLALGEKWIQASALNVLKGAGLGAIAGAAGAGVTVLIDPQALKDERKFSTLAQIAGLLAETYFTYASRNAFNSDTYQNGQILEKIFVDPLGKMVQHWPTHLTSALQIWAAHSLSEDKAYLAGLLRGTIGAVAYPVFTKLELTFKPGEKLCLIITTKSSQSTYESTTGTSSDKQKTLSLTQEVGIRLIEALVSGGLYAVIDHNIDMTKNPAGYVLASGIANLGTAVAGGVARYAFSNETDLAKAVRDNITESILGTEESGKKYRVGGYINEAFSFGLPDSNRRPGDVIYAEDWVGYMSRLRYLSSLTTNYGFSVALAYQSGSAYINAAANTVEDNIRKIMLETKAATTTTPKTKSPEVTFTYNRTLENRAKLDLPKVNLEFAMPEPVTETPKLSEIKVEIDKKVVPPEDTSLKTPQPPPAGIKEEKPLEIAPKLTPTDE